MIIPFPNWDHKWEKTKAGTRALLQFQNTISCCCLRIRARWRQIRRFVLEFKARYFFLNSYIRCFLFEKSNLRVQKNNTLNLECKEVLDQFIENLDFPYIFCNSTVSKLQKIWGFLKTDHGRLCTPDSVYCFFELVSYSFQRESIKYVNSGRISWLWILTQIFEFPAILPWLPMMQPWAWTPLYFFKVCRYRDQKRKSPWQNSALTGAKRALLQARSCL